MRTNAISVPINAFILVLFTWAALQDRAGADRAWSQVIVGQESRPPATQGATRKAVKRLVTIRGTEFVDYQTGKSIVLQGPNVVVKGPPWLPSTGGDSACIDEAAPGVDPSHTCKTFNQHDLKYLRSQGYNAIRLGVSWAGAQPNGPGALDEAWIKRLHAILDVCERFHIAVVLDSHTDMVSSANCGFGVPYWVGHEACSKAGIEIGAPLTVGFPFSLVFGIDPNLCTPDQWAANSSRIDYNVVNECCLSLNSGNNNNNVGFTTAAQATVNYVMKPGAGRSRFVDFWTRVAAVVKDKPAAVAIEPMNEPVSIEIKNMYDTWIALHRSVQKVADIPIALSDVGQFAGTTIPLLDKVLKFLPGLHMTREQEDTIRNATGSYFFAYHWYGQPADPLSAAQFAHKESHRLGVPAMLTETATCEAIRAAQSFNISWSWWHYSKYCTPQVQPGTEGSFGACVLGWDGASIRMPCDRQSSEQLQNL